MKKIVLKTFPKFIWKHQCRVSFLIKLQASGNFYVSVFAKGEVSIFKVTALIKLFIFQCHIFQKKWPVNNKWFQTRKMNHWKVYRKSSKMLKSTRRMSDCCVIYLLRNIRGRLQMFCKKGVLKTFYKIHRKIPVPESLFLTKLQLH